MNDHEPRSSLAQLTTVQEQRLRSAGLAVRERGARSTPVTAALAGGRARRRRALTGASATLAVVLLGLVIVSLGTRRTSTTVRTGSTGGSEPATTAVPPAAPPTVVVHTPTVSLQADQLQIDAAGQTFAPPAHATGLDVNSDPGTSPPNGYTTLELSWAQHGVQMRMNLYFRSDATRWWANEIRIYNGEAAGADWVTFDGRWFDSPLGHADTGDLHLARGGAALSIQGLDLQAFLRPKACDDHQTSDALQALYPTVRMGLPPAGYGVAVRLYDRSCAPITDLSGVSLTWTAADPSIVTVATSAGVPATTAGLTGLRPGSTVVHVTATDKATGSVLATTSMQVAITG